MRSDILRVVFEIVRERVFPRIISTIFLLKTAHQRWARVFPWKVGKGQGLRNTGKGWCITWKAYTCI